VRVRGLIRQRQVSEVRDLPERSSVAAKYGLKSRLRRTHRHPEQVVPRLEVPCTVHDTGLCARRVRHARAVLQRRVARELRRSRTVLQLYEVTDSSRRRGNHRQSTIRPRNGVHRADATHKVRQRLIRWVGRDIRTTVQAVPVWEFRRRIRALYVPEVPSRQMEPTARPHTVLLLSGRQNELRFRSNGVQTLGAKSIH